MRAEVEDNVMLGIATALAQNPSLAKPSPYFATVHDDGDVVVCALRTPPHKLVISRTADLSALHLEAAPERLRSGSLFVWDNDGPVSMAGWTGKTLNGVRVTFVYTPPEFRRHGYASACVAALTQRLLDEGNRYCCLYTDLANPTSNRIYQQIGYRAVCDVADYALAV